MQCCHKLNAALAVLAMIIASGHHGRVTCPAGGVQTTFPISDLPSGWSVHYDAPYSDATQLSDIRPGRGECILWAAKEQKTATEFAIVAFGDRTKIEEMSPVWDNDVYWYTVEGKANGFSSLPNIDLRPGDLGPYQCFNRLSWLLEGDGGFRAGCDMNLNKDNSWRKIVMFGPQADYCSAFECPRGYYERNDAPRFCQTTECTLMECCDLADQCRESLCSAGYYLKIAGLPEFCSSSSCQRAECCDQKPRCWPINCPLQNGYILKRSRGLPEWCKDGACTTNECCDPAPLCAGHDCPWGLVNSNTTYCAAHNCTHTECCWPAGVCSAADCTGGYTPRKVGMPEFCGGISCTTSECCDPPPPKVYVSDAIFHDFDFDLQEIGGTLEWTPPENANNTVEYFVVYIADSHSDQFRRLVGKSPWGVNSLVIPEETQASSKFLVYTANRGGEQEIPATFPVSDVAYLVSNLTFIDLDLDDGELGGVVKWDFPNGSNPITHYAVYLSGLGNESQLMGVLVADVKNLVIPPDTALGRFSRIKVATLSGTNEQTNPAAVSIVDTVARVSHVKFIDEQDQPGLVGGSISWVPPPSTLLVANYRVYFESTNTSDRIELNEGVPVGVNEVILPAGTEKKNFTHVCVYTVSDLAEQSTPATAPLDEKEDFALVLVMVAAGSVAGIRAMSVIAGASTAASTAGNSDLEALEKAPSKNDQKNIMEVRVTDRYVSCDGQELVIRHMETPGLRTVLNSLFPLCVHPHHRKILVTHSGKNTVMYRHTQCKNCWFCDFMIVKMLANNVISVHGLGDKRVRLKRKRPLCNRFMDKGSWDMVLRAFFPPAGLLVIASIIVWMQETALGLILCVTTSVSVVALCLAKPGSVVSNCVVAISEAPPSRFRTHFWRCVGLITSLLPCAPAFMSNTDLGWITGSVAAACALFTFVGFESLSCLVEIAAGIFLAAMALLEHQDAEGTDARTAAVIVAVFLSASLILVKGVDGCLASYSSLYLNIRLTDDSLLTAAQEMADVTGVGTVRAVALEAFASGKLEAHMQDNLVKALHSLAKRLVSICNTTLERAREEMSGEAFKKAGQSIESQLKRIVTIAGPSVGANTWQASQHLEELHSAMTKMKTKSFGEATIKRCRESILRVRVQVSKLEAALAVAARYLVLEATARHRVSAEVFGLYGVTTATTAEGAGMRLSGGELSIVQIGRLTATVDIMQEQTARMKKVLDGMQHANSAPPTDDAALSFAACECACGSIDDALQAVQRLLRPRTPVVEGELQQNLGSSEINAISDWFTDVTEGGKAVDKLCQRLKDLASPEDELHMQLEPDVRGIVLQLAPQSTQKDFVEKAAFALHIMRSVAVISDRVLEEVESLLERADRAVQSLSDARADGLRALDKLRRGRAGIDKMSINELDLLQDEIMEVLAGSATSAAVRIHAISYLEKTGRLQDWVKEEFARIMLPLRLAAEPSSPMEPLQSIRVPPAVTGAFDDEGETAPPPPATKYHTKTFLAETEEDLSGTEHVPEMIQKARSQKRRHTTTGKRVSTGGEATHSYGLSTKDSWRGLSRAELEARPRRQTIPAPRAPVPRAMREHERLQGLRGSVR